MEQTEEEVADERKHRAGRQGAETRRGGDEGTDDYAEDEREQDAGGVGPGVFHRVRLSLFCHGGRSPPETKSK